MKRRRSAAVKFNDYRMLRLFEAPEVEVHFVASGVRITGLGEAIPAA
jgi:CO/xanthine dehydrogenase Mo-binding subunit